MKDKIISGFESNNWKFQCKNESTIEQEYVFKKVFANSEVIATFYFPQKELVIEDSPTHTKTIFTLFNGKIRNLSDLKLLDEMLFV